MITGDEKNALAVLAERLRFHAEVAESGHALDDHASIDLDDAYRIVAELAKVGDWIEAHKNDDGVSIINGLKIECADRYSRCLNIAKDKDNDKA